MERKKAKKNNEVSVSLFSRYKPLKKMHLSGNDSLLDFA